jgi:hypothetical protein
MRTFSNVIARPAASREIDHDLADGAAVCDMP